MERHFVTFFSPGTFTAEENIETIEAWDVAQAVEMAKGIVQRYNATPFGFQFSTRERNDGELDSHTSKRSGMYYLGGEVLTYDDLVKRDDPDEKILRSNMRCNGWDRIIVNTNSWKWTAPLLDGDVVLAYP